eukprot:c11291_g1_i2.p1 GENE.c11291_g1_i2~~c11291_g1_i2.p1  ORF type:complete len:482 (+),score=142.70 c11291_g1_i2:45-1490(+)
MVLGELGSSISRALRTMSSALVINEEVVDALLKELGNALIAADVNVMMVAKMRKNIKAAISLDELAAGLNKRKIIQKAVFDELCKLLDSGRQPFKPKKGQANVIMFVGLQGSGKTTTCTKLAHLYQSKGWKVGMVCADTFRAGAFDQLKQNCTKARIPYYGDYTESNPAAVAAAGVDKFRDEAFEIIIVDTSGRHRQEAALFEEMEEVKDAVSPDSVVFVLDSTIGQAAQEQAEAFKAKIDIAEVILTKLDGHARGGGALSAVAATKAPIIFIGTGEHIDELEPFEATSFVSRLLGYGDVAGLVNKITEAGLDNQEELVERLQAGLFTLRDLADQFQNVQSLGSISQLMSMIPGMGSNLIPKGKEQESQERIRKFTCILDSCTAAELDGEAKWIPSRIARVARGSGTSIKMVSELLEEHKRMATAIKKLKGAKFGKNGQPNMAAMSKMIPPHMMQQMGGPAGLAAMMKQMSAGGMPGMPGM